MPADDRSHPAGTTGPDDIATSDGPALDRRALIGSAALVASLAACARDGPASRAWSRVTAGQGDWDDVRALFPLSDEWIDMGAMLLTSHPKPVADAIDRHRRALDDNPVIYLNSNNKPLQGRARDAAGHYLGVAADDIALTDSTTQGVALVYQGLRLRPGQEVLTTDRDYYVTHEALRLAARRSGAHVRRVVHVDSLDGISAAALVDGIIGQIRPETRALALTWVHSSTGLKLPVAAIAAEVARLNAGRDAADRILFCLDGVHGFGNQAAGLADLGVDFLMTGCHKWLFGPRGTGIIAGTARGWQAIDPTIPSFTDSDAYDRWKRDDPAPPTTAAMVSPGGFKAFEHVWALAEAFDLHQALGKPRIEARTAELAGQLKDGLAAMAGVQLRTPRSAALSAGIVSFDVDGRSPWEIVGKLRDAKMIASVAPYRSAHVRLTPSIRNSPAEIEAVLKALRAIVGRA